MQLENRGVVEATPDGAYGIIPSRMRWKKHKSQGFTLIEIMMVLAISSLLMLILLGGYNQSRRRAQFTDAVERMTVQLEQAKNEANSTVNVNPSQGTDLNTVVFAKAADFATNPNQLLVQTLRVPRSDTLIDPVTLDPANLRTVDIPWGASFVSPTDASPTRSTHNFVVFSRSTNDGRLNTFVFNLSTANDLGSSVLYAPGLPADTETAVLVFRSAEGEFLAQITVNATNGEIKRQYLN